MPELKAAKMCGVCGEVLHRIKGRVPIPRTATSKFSTGEWIHARELTGSVDHAAVPVDYDERNLVAKCDFCSGTMTPDERWYLEAEDFTVVVQVDNIGNVEHRSRSGWSACPVCAPLVAGQDWQAIIERHMKVVAGMYKPEIAEFIHDVMLPAMFGELEQHTLAPIRLWQAGDELSLRED